MIGVGLAALALCACTSDPERRIVGKWQLLDGQEVLEFTHQGTVISADEHGPLFGGRFRFMAEDTVQVTFGGPASYAPPQNYKVSMSDSELVVTDEKGEAKSYRRFEE